MSKIDTSKCKYYFDSVCVISGGELLHYRCTNCRETKNCYYKQLQQLKQENEELAYKIEALTNASYNLSANNWQLERKLEKIKEVARQVRGYLKYPEPRDVRYEMDRILQIIESEVK